VRLIKFNAALNLVVSTDRSGMIEIWDPETRELPESDGRLSFDILSDTDYYELVMKKTYALSLEFSYDFKTLAIYCRDRKIRLFDFGTGKLVKTFVETIENARKLQGDDSAASMVKLEQLDFEKRIATEAEIEKVWDQSNESVEVSQSGGSYNCYLPNVQFDESGTYLTYGSPVGIKLLNIR
jgi:peptidylprolyl isomerase domain and WD repeat-containing protein 1